MVFLGAPKPRPVLDGGLYFDAHERLPSGLTLLAALQSSRVQGALAFAQNSAQPDEALAALQLATNHRVLCAPLIDVLDSRALQRQAQSLAWRCRILALSALGNFHSPMRAIDLETIESVGLWRAAAASGQILAVEPRLSDAHLLPYLAAAFPNVRVLVQGALVCRPEAGAALPRKLPLPERFTFDRLHQLPNIWIQCCAASARRVPTWPASTKGGWHGSSNLLALFSPNRLIWASMSTVDREANYGGLGDPSCEFPALDPREREALTGEALCALLA
jgi:hypothetical protein